jgi:hypothetical protein
MNLLTALEKGALNDIKVDILSLDRGTKKSNRHLNSIRLDEFLIVMTKHITGNDERVKDIYKYFSTKEGLSLSYLLCFIFETVDVDSRGVISWQDFTNFCLRVGRIRFKPSVKRSLSSFKQESYSGPHYNYPVSRLTFVPHTQILFAFDVNTPTVRLYGCASYCFIIIDTVLIMFYFLFL